MQYRKFDDVYVIRLDTDDNIIESLRRICVKNSINAGVISGLGVARDVSLICYDRIAKAPVNRDFAGDWEISSLVGNVSILDGEISVHVHVNLTDEKFNVFGGHLVQGKIGMTAEIFIKALDGSLMRQRDNSWGINILSM